MSRALPTVPGLVSWFIDDIFPGAKAKVEAHFAKKRKVPVELADADGPPKQRRIAGADQY